MTLDELKDCLMKKGYNNLRVESARSCYILADKDGRTFVYYPDLCTPDTIK